MAALRLPRLAMPGVLIAAWWLMSTASADIIQVPPFAGMPMSSVNQWEFSNPPGTTPTDRTPTPFPSTYTGPGLVNTSVANSATIPSQSFTGVSGGWVAGTGGGSMSFTVNNFIDNEPIKLLWVEITYSLGIAQTPPAVTSVTGFASNGTTTGNGTSNGVSNPTNKDSNGNPLPTGFSGIVDFWQVTPNPAYETIAVNVPQGDVINEVVIYTISTVPEPGPIVLAVVGAGCFFGFGWCRSRTRAKA